MRNIVLLVLIVMVIGVAYYLWALRATPTQSGDALDVPAEYVGSGACSSCHSDAYAKWRGSHHDLAMQQATTSTVLGDFSDVEYNSDGVRSAFHTRDGRFFVRTDNADGQSEEFEVRYTFGAYPLQQYLVAFPGGRYQALRVAWDARPPEQGGQRWFHLYADEEIPPTDELHWTRRSQNWNFMCADCHSTDLRRNYDVAKDSYDTEWAEINVACEACHGPGSNHVTWAQEANGAYDDDNRLVIQLNGAGEWYNKTGVATAARADARDDTQLEACARCHSRRSSLGDGYNGGSLFDDYRPALLTDPLYYHDGQIRDEVYVYGSFLQSKMHGAGVTCSDCHDPHSLQLRAAGNALCATCHSPAVFDTSDHHFHPANSSGAQCVSCHMPARTYMVVDPRRDHSLRVPRPDLSLQLGVPNACNDCHSDRTPQWAAEELKRRGVVPAGHFARTFAQARAGAVEGTRDLYGIIASDDAAAIVRATAVVMLRDADPRGLSQQELLRAMGDDSPLVRLGSVRAVEALPPDQRWAIASSALDDPARVVRVEAARVLAGTPPELLQPFERAKLEAACAEYVASEMANAELPSAYLNLGLFYSARGDVPRARAAYQHAISMEPRAVAPRVNLADLYRALGEDDASLLMLREAASLAPDNADVQHAFGLALVRSGDYEAALTALARAVELQPHNVRYSYVYALGLNQTGASDDAMAVVEAALSDHPDDADLLFALATMYRDAGRRDDAVTQARRLVVLYPNDANFSNLLRQLQGTR